MKLSNFFISLFFYILLVGGCAKDIKSSFAQFYYEEPIELGIEEEIVDSNQNIRIKVISVIEDSRCQKNVPCVTEGRLRIEIELLIDSMISRHYIIYKKDKVLQKRIKNIGIQLTKVFPENQIDEEIKQEEYLFTMLINPI